MREDPGPGAIISEDEIIRLVNLFQQFEGATIRLAMSDVKANRASTPWLSRFMPKR
jgi:hypothetical protein